MKQDKLTLWMMASLLSSSAFAHDNVPQRLQNFNSETFYTIDPIQDSTNVKTVQPVYNLYQLSKLISSKQNNISAAGYINNLMDNSKLSEDEKDILRVKLFKNLSIVSEKNKFEEQLKEYLVNRLNNIDNISFLEKYNVKDLKNRIESIHHLNLILSKYKSVNLIESLNNEIPLIYTALSDIKLKRTQSINLINKEKLDSTSSQINPENDTLITDINRVIELSGNFKINSLDDGTLILLNSYYKSLNLLKIDKKETQFYNSLSKITSTLKV